jgi:hypothetical protein
MAARESLEEKLAAIRALRGQTLTSEQKLELKKRIGDRSNLVVAAASAIAGENTLVELAPDLETAFDRFLVNPLKDDKLCRAKLAVVQALDRMEHPKADVFLKAARHVQFEPTWGASKVRTPFRCWSMQWPTTRRMCGSRRPWRSVRLVRKAQD